MLVAEIGIQIARFDAREFGQVIDHLLLRRYVFVHERYTFVGAASTEERYDFRLWIILPARINISQDSRQHPSRIIMFCMYELRLEAHPRMHVIRATLM